MKMIWHIMKKDFCAVWPLWLAWMGLIAVRILLVVYFLHYAGESMLRWMTWAGVLSFIADALLVLSLVRSLVHTDALVGDRAYWLTRPISRSKLLAAKVGGALVVCGLSPLTLLVPMWLGLGFIRGEILRVLLYHGIFNGMACIAGFGMAAVTRKSGSFWLWLIVVVVATIGAFVGLIEGFGVGWVLDQVDPFMAMLMGAAVIAFGVAWRFAGRRVSISWLCIVAGIGPFAISVPFMENRFDMWELERGVEMSTKVGIHENRVRVTKSWARRAQVRALELLFTVPKTGSYTWVEPRFLDGAWKISPGGEVRVDLLNGRQWLRRGGDFYNAAHDAAAYRFSYQFEKGWLPEGQASLPKLAFSGRLGLRFFKEEVLLEAEICPSTTVRRGSHLVRFLPCGDELDPIAVKYVKAQASNNRLAKWKFLNAEGIELKYGGDFEIRGTLLWVHLEKHSLRKRFVEEVFRSQGLKAVGPLTFVLTAERLVGWSVSELKSERLEFVDSEFP